MKESERNERNKLFFYPFDTYKPHFSITKMHFYIKYNRNDAKSNQSLFS